jgi:hypothetical protein
MSDEDNDLTLEAQLGENDWAIIIGDDGNLKGIYIPQGKDEDLVPESIVEIMAEYFGVDFDEEDTEYVPPGETLH